MSVLSNTAGRLPLTPDRTGLRFQIFRDETAIRWLEDNKSAWRDLLERCRWGTAFQSPEFFEIWHRHYGGAWTPLLVVAHKGPDLAGLMPLATKDGLITGVGAHQADYHGWISEQADADEFVAGAVDSLTAAMPGRTLRLRYLPPALPVEIVHRLRDRNKRVELMHQRSDEFALDREAIERSLRKKGNASKLNRLKRSGDLDIRPLSGEDLLAHWGRVTAWNDFRQGAINGVCPFLDDPKKAAFHIDWIESAPHQVNATLLFVDGKPCSALLFAVSKNELHLAISAHAPEMARNSPMKFHLYRTALTLAGEGWTVLDLTPGGDAWKRRFSTKVRDAWELVVHGTLADAARARLGRTTRNAARRALAALGLSPARLRAAWNAARILRSRRAPRRKPETLYRLEPADFAAGTTPLQVKRNDLEFLVRHGGELTKLPRQAFLQSALERIESGERCYSVTGSGRPICLGWLSPSAHRLYEITFARDIAATPALNALVAGVLAEAGDADKLWMAISADDRLERDLRHMGFAPVE